MTVRIDINAWERVMPAHGPILDSDNPLRWKRSAVFSRVQEMGRAAGRTDIILDGVRRIAASAPKLVLVFDQKGDSVNVAALSPGRERRTARRALVALLGMALLVTTVANPAHAEKKETVAPAAVPIPNIEVQIESRLQNLLTPVLTVAADTQVRGLIRNIAAREFDGDTNALWSTVIQEAEESYIVDPYAREWQALKNAVAQFQNIDGYAYDPQVYIPNQDEGIPVTSFVTLAVAPADEYATSASGYQVDPYGNVGVFPNLVDETYMETYEVWVLSVNERIETYGSTSLDEKAKPAEQVQPAGKPQVAAPEGPNAASTGPNALLHPQAVCNPTGLRYNRGMEYLQRWRAASKTSFGGLFGGRLQMRLILITSTGVIVKDHPWDNKIKRKHSTNWQNVDLFLTTWDTAVWGQVLAFKWIEMDGGKTKTSTISVPLPGGGSVSTSVTHQERDDDGGIHSVLFSESTYIEYDTGRIRFNVCSQGGDGGTGNDNFACGAIASASSVYPAYSASRATDCIRDTRMGGPYSWANNAGTWPPGNPEWVQADFGVDRTIRRVVVLTSEGYPIRDFDVQVWNSVTYVTVATVRGNTQLAATATFGARTTRLVRILARSGPDHQTGFVRVNELEAYAV